MFFLTFNQKVQIFASGHDSCYWRGCTILVNVKISNQLRSGGHPKLKIIISFVDHASDFEE